MFTSEPSLAQRIERMFGDTPIVDPFSQIRCDQPGASDLAELMNDRRVVVGLIAAGMPTNDLLDPLPTDERVRRSIPYLKRMRNTSAAWCLFRIFRDLYDFDEPNLTEGNYRDLFDKVAATGQDPDWARTVLVEKSKIRAIVTSLDQRDEVKSKHFDSFFFRLDAHSLIGASQGNDPEALTALLGERPATAERLERLIFDWLDRTVTGRVRFTSMALPIEHRFGPPDTAQIDAILNLVGGQREDLTDEKVVKLSSFVAWSLLKWHHENKKTIQFLVGGKSIDPYGQSLPMFQETWTSEMAGTFRRFDGARFGLMTASDFLGQDVAALAGQLANVYSSGDLSHGFTPTAIEKNLGLRVEVAPMTKIVGFASDAPSVEWVYGKLQVVRKAMAAALARQVDARFFEEDEIPPLLRQILHDTPVDFYGLSAQ